MYLKMYNSLIMQVLNGLINTSLSNKSKLSNDLLHLSKGNMGSFKALIAKYREFNDIKVFFYTCVVTGWQECSSCGLL